MFGEAGGANSEAEKRGLFEAEVVRMWRVGWWYNCRRVDGILAGGAKWLGRGAEVGATTFIMLGEERSLLDNCWGPEEFICRGEGEGTEMSRDDQPRWSE